MIGLHVEYTIYLYTQYLKKSMLSCSRFPIFFRIDEFIKKEKLTMGFLKISKGFLFNPNFTFGVDYVI